MGIGKIITEWKQVRLSNKIIIQYFILAKTWLDMITIPIMEAKIIINIS